MNRREATAPLLALGAIRSAASVPSPREAGLIDRLIASVAFSKEVIFIRNGTDATAGAAAKRVQDSTISSARTSPRRTISSASAERARK